VSARVAPARAAVDTNLLVSGLISAGGPPARIVDGFRSNRFELVVTPQVLDELLDVLLRPYLAISVREAASMVATIRMRAHLVGGEYLDVDMVPGPRGLPARPPFPGIVRSGFSAISTRQP
jgi:hypothetical protein